MLRGTEASGERVVALIEVKFTEIDFSQARGLRGPLTEESVRNSWLDRREYHLAGFAVFGKASLVRPVRSHMGHNRAVVRRSALHTRAPRRSPAGGASPALASSPPGTPTITLNVRALRARSWSARRAVLRSLRGIPAAGS